MQGQMLSNVAVISIVFTMCLFGYIGYKLSMIDNKLDKALGKLKKNE